MRKKSINNCSKWLKKEPRINKRMKKLRRVKIKMDRMKRMKKLRI